jgi:hypothetical protein
VFDEVTGRPVKVLRASLATPEPPSNPGLAMMEEEEILTWPLSAQSVLPAKVSLPRPPRLTRARLVLETEDHGRVIAGPVDVTCLFTVRVPRAAAIVVELSGAGKEAPVTVGLWHSFGQYRGPVLLRTARAEGGRARFQNLAAGSYLAGAWPHSTDFAARCSQEIAVAGEDVALPMEIERAGAVSGIVLSAAGAPVPWASVELSRAADEGLFHDFKLDGTLSDAQGRFEIAGVPPGGWTLRGNLYEPVKAAADPQEIVVEPGKPLVLTLRLK